MDGWMDGVREVWKLPLASPCLQLLVTCLLTLLYHPSPSFRPSGSLKVPEGTRSRYKLVPVQWPPPEGAELELEAGPPRLPLPPSQLQNRTPGPAALSAIGGGGRRVADPGAAPYSGVLGDVGKGQELLQSHPL